MATLGGEIWEYFAKEPDAAKDFTLAMTSFTAPIAYAGQGDRIAVIPTRPAGHRAEWHAVLNVTFATL
jgi:hypothetical protein